MKHAPFGEDVEINTRPQKGKGDRWLDCKYYEDCLDLAALKNWHSFTCTSCPLYQHVFKNMGNNMETANKSRVQTMTTQTKATQASAPEKKEENTRMCEQCHERVTISPSSPLCAHCMAVKSNKARKRPENRLKVTNPTHSIPQTFKTQHRANLKLTEKADNKTTPPSPTIHINKTEEGQHKGTMALTIDLESYAHVLDGLKRIAEYELRPLDKQIIYILKEYVRTNEAIKGL